MDVPKNGVSNWRKREVSAHEVVSTCILSVDHLYCVKKRSNQTDAVGDTD